MGTGRVSESHEYNLLHVVESSLQHYQNNPPTKLKTVLTHEGGISLQEVAALDGNSPEQKLGNQGQGWRSPRWVGSGE